MVSVGGIKNVADVSTSKGQNTCILLWWKMLSQADCRCVAQRVVVCDNIDPGWAKHGFGVQSFGSRGTLDNSNIQVPGKYSSPLAAFGEAFIYVLIGEADLFAQTTRQHENLTTS